MIKQLDEMRLRQLRSKCNAISDYREWSNDQSIEYLMNVVNMVTTEEAIIKCKLIHSSQNNSNIQSFIGDVVLREIKLRSNLIKKQNDYYHKISNLLFDENSVADLKSQTLRCIGIEKKHVDLTICFLRSKFPQKKKNNDCIVCNNKFATMLYMSCMHVALCAECCEIWRADKQYCPVCRRDEPDRNHIKQIFLSGFQ